ncbi:MAG: hypothetical protein PVI41_05910 [Roseobacter sp.]|jgi:hypothetical protein
MTDTTAEKVWWTAPIRSDVKTIAIKPYFSDVDLENSRLEDMAQMERSIQSYRPYPADYIPDELRWFQRVVTEKDRNLPDAFKGYAGTLVISEAMRDVLAEFDLESSQMFECPLYDIKPTDDKLARKLGRTEADRTRQDPRRWFLRHISETKTALRVEHVKDLEESISRPGI